MQSCNNAFPKPRDTFFSCYGRESTQGASVLGQIITVSGGDLSLELKPNFSCVQPRVHHVAQTDHSQMQPQPQVQSQSLAMHQPHDAFSSPKDNNVQDSLAQNTIGQCQSNHPHASWTGLNPQPNQTNQVEAPPNNMFEYHEDHFAEQVLKYGGASVPESSYMHSLHQLILSNPSLPQQQTVASTTDVVHNQMHQEGPSYNLDIALQEHQHIPTILGVQPNMNHFSATAPQVGLGHAAPSLQRIPKQLQLFVKVVIIE
ncbi:hypothetical protein F2Q70_00005482 [Brassica cretica]|uniref:Uncharacterized protein n=1 Tax=Brassica cretica TaxID=69181 RepID=A0A8S9IMN6_BRACR|nr:hypothetical protein F2Q70_00005482 [Brassica cretica]